MIFQNEFRFKLQNICFFLKQSQFKFLMRVPKKVCHNFVVWQRSITNVLSCTPKNYVNYYCCVRLGNSFVLDIEHCLVYSCYNVSESIPPEAILTPNSSQNYLSKTGCFKITFCKVCQCSAPEG